jgi:hypothetical protein
MKPITKSILLIILIGVYITDINAQRVDMERMNQDLRISERILDELLQSNQRETVFFPTSSRMNSLYIPGFGVIFDVNPPLFLDPARIATINIRGAEGDSDERNIDIVETDGTQTRVSATGVASSTRNVQRSAESINQTKDAIRNFLGSYADIIGQLPASETITVMVRQSTSFAFRSATPQTQSGTSASAVSVSRAAESKGYTLSVRRSDIADYKAQRINQQEFYNRIRETQITDESQPDFQIFEKILETGLSGDQNKSFSLNRGLSRIYDEQLGLVILGSIRNPSGSGVLGIRSAVDMQMPDFSEFEFDFNIDIKDSTQGNFYRFQMEESPDSTRRRLQRLERDLKMSEEEIRRGAEEIRRTAVELRRALVGESRETRSKEEVMADFEAFETEAKNLLINYGRTLNSLKSDQVVILSLSQRRDIQGIPSRLVLSVKKSTLDAYDRRSITKEAALAQITVIRN